MNRNRARLDNYYTPAWAADALARVLPDSLKGGVLDPAVGGGALLEAVETRFGRNVSLLGIDISKDAVRQLRQTHPAWSVSNADLLRAPSRRASQAWRSARSDDLAAVVMNPPFSYRGNGGALVEYGSFRGRVAPAMHFLTEVVRSLQPSDGFFAILPDGALDAERHQELWQQLQAHYSIERIARLGNSSFRGARVSTSIVQLRPWRDPPIPPALPIVSISSPSAPQTVSSCHCVEVVRGRIPLHSLASLRDAETSAPFIHTTELGSTALDRSAPARLADVAPLLLISRVGKWRTPRLIEVGHVVLSDCLFGLRPRDKAGLSRLTASLPEFAPHLQSRMRGTGAPYLTLVDVVRVLHEAGWHVHVVKASHSVGACCCDNSARVCAREPTLREHEAASAAV